MPDQPYVMCMERVRMQEAFGLFLVSNFPEILKGVVFEQLIVKTQFFEGGSNHAGMSACP